MCAQSLLADDTKQYEAARANNDKAGMVQAHEHAEAIRWYAARANTYNMMQFFGVSDPTGINLPENAMVFLENVRSFGYDVEGRTVNIDFDKYCEYVFAGVSLGTSGMSVRGKNFNIGTDIAMTAGYVYNVHSLEDYKGFFAGTSTTTVAGFIGGAIAWNGVYSEILGGTISLACSAGVRSTYYVQIQDAWVFRETPIKWY